MTTGCIPPFDLLDEWHDHKFFWVYLAALCLVFNPVAIALVIVGLVGLAR